MINFGEIIQFGDYKNIFYDLWPSFLSTINIFDKPLISGYIINILFVTGNCVLLYKICKKMESSKAGIIALVTYLLSLQVSFWSSSLYKDTFLSFLVCISAYLYIHNRDKSTTIFIAMMAVIRIAYSALVAAVLIRKKSIILLLLPLVAVAFVTLDVADLFNLYFREARLEVVFATMPVQTSNIFLQLTILLTVGLMGVLLTPYYLGETTGDIFKYSWLALSHGIILAIFVKSVVVGSFLQLFKSKDTRGLLIMVLAYMSVLAISGLFLTLRHFYSLYPLIIILFSLTLVRNKTAGQFMTIILSAMAFACLNIYMFLT
ncbi:MAG: hypothetical protein KAI89_06040 [Emcibacter sp.]|nr:hypothetical protein [Emcibacter sp.]